MRLGQRTLKRARLGEYFRTDAGACSASFCVVHVSALLIEPKISSARAVVISTVILRFVTLGVQSFFLGLLNLKPRSEV